MSGRARAAGLVGAAAGAALVAVALPLEIAARDLPFRGGLWQLQSGSVAIWIVETLPLLIGAAMYAVASGRVRAVEAPGPPAEVELPPAPSPAPPLGALPPPPVPPPLPSTLTTAQVLGVQASDARVQALQELVRTVREQADRAEQESRGKSRTVAKMAAVLRTPLTDILGRAELLEEEGDELGARHRHQVREVVRSARLLTSVVGELLDLSKLEVGALSLVVQDVDLAQVAEEVRTEASTAAELQRSRYDCEIAADARFVRGDHGRVRQLALGLLGHAFRVTRGGSVSLSAERMDEAGRRWVVLRVRDTGPGLQPEEVEELLEGTDPAFGLGVTLGRRLTELMGGRLSVASSAEGTTFTVLLPRADDRRRLVSLATIPPDERLAGLHVLLVDADPGGVSLMRALERAGVVVHLVADLRSASIAADAEDTWLALVDVGLPGAWSLVEDLVATKVKVVATSLRDEDLEEALERGATAFLVRPLERRVVLATLQRALDPDQLETDLGP